MKRVNQYPEQAPDQLALLVLDFEPVQGVELDGWRLNAQPKNLPPAAAHYGVQVSIRHKWCGVRPASLLGAAPRKAAQRLPPAGRQRRSRHRRVKLRMEGTARFHADRLGMHNIPTRDTIDEAVFEWAETKPEMQHIPMAAMKRRRLG